MAENKETGTLIGSDKVEGTAVYGSDREQIGSIERVMIDKVSGKISYAVLSFGGFLGIGHDHYPLPWSSLKYDTSLGGYITGISEAQLKGLLNTGTTNGTGRTRPVRAQWTNTTLLEVQTTGKRAAQGVGPFSCGAGRSRVTHFGEKPHQGVRGAGARESNPPRQIVRCDAGKNA